MAPVGSALKVVQHSVIAAAIHFEYGSATNNHASSANSAYVGGAVYVALRILGENVAHIKAVCPISEVMKHGIILSLGPYASHRHEGNG
jgi:hypothetical protein